MPTYDYKCLNCNSSFEVFQKINDEPIKSCPECGGKVKKLIGAGLTPVFKGSGFYQTDYKSNNSESKKESKTSITKKDLNKNNKTSEKKSA